MQYKRSATENVLLTHNLNTGEYLKSIGKPANLIILLYEHPSIDQRIQNPTGRGYPGECPSSEKKAHSKTLSKIIQFVNVLSLPVYADIHMAANEIAEINSLDINKIWDKLLNKYLCPTVLPSEVSRHGRFDFGEKWPVT